MKVLIMVGFGPVVRDSKKSKEMYSGTMGIEF